MLSTLRSALATLAILSLGGAHAHAADMPQSPAGTPQTTLATLPGPAVADATAIAPDAATHTLRLPEAEQFGFVMSIPLEPGGAAVPVLFEPISVRDPEFRLFVQNASGELVDTDPGPERTFTARPWQHPDTEIAASFIHGGLFAAIHRPNQPIVWIQPLDPRAAAAPGSDVAHAVYWCDNSDDGGRCGNIDTAAPAQGAVAGGGCGVGGTTCRAQVAFDTDVEFYQQMGGSAVATRDFIAALTNVVNHQYRREVGIWHDITAIIVRTAEPDPYTATEVYALINEFGNQWNASLGFVTRDIAHLCTGKDLDGTILGLGVFDSVCDPSISYSLSMTAYSIQYCRLSNLLAHEFAHNWSARHCACPSSAMWEGGNICANTFEGAGSDSIAAITAWRDSVGCLDTETPPANDLCTNATVVVRSGLHFANNIDASTDGGATGCGAAFPGDIGGGTRDVWFRVSPGRSGEITVATCGSAINSVVSVHTGCPGTPENQVACNDDACGVQSEVTFQGFRGTTYYVRVAGYFGSQGAIVAEFTMPEPLNNDCPDATVLTPDVPLYGYLGGSTTDGEGCADGLGASDIWFAFTAPCSGTLTVDTCGSHDRGGLVDQGVDTVLSIHTGCPGDLGNMLGCNDNTAVCDNDAGVNGDSRLVLLMTAGQTIYVRATWADQFGTGLFSIYPYFQPNTLEPRIAQIPDETHPVGVPYVGPVPQLQNAACIEAPTWSLFAAPAGMTIDPATGVVSWANPSPFGSPHTVTIRAANAEGLDLETWLLTIDNGPCPGQRGDANCDGSIDFFDIDPFLQALFDRPAYQMAFCNAGICGVDTNCDGNIDFFDIDPLIVCLFEGCAPCP